MLVGVSRMLSAQTGVRCANHFHGNREFFRITYSNYAPLKVGTWRNVSRVFS